MINPAAHAVSAHSSRSVLRSDNEPGGITELLALNDYYRNNAWPPPYDSTRHCIRLADARDLSWLEDETIPLVFTSPPYFTLKKYETNANQLGEIEDYESFNVK